MADIRPTFLIPQIPLSRGLDAVDVNRLVQIEGQKYDVLMRLALEQVETVVTIQFMADGETGKLPPDAQCACDVTLDEAKQAVIQLVDSGRVKVLTEIEERCNAEAMAFAGRAMAVVSAARQSLRQTGQVRTIGPGPSPSPLAATTPMAQVTRPMLPVTRQMAVVSTPIDPTTEVDLRPPFFTPLVAVVAALLGLLSIVACAVLLP